MQRFAERLEGSECSLARDLLGGLKGVSENIRESPRAQQRTPSNSEHLIQSACFAICEMLDVFWRVIPSSDKLMTLFQASKHLPF